MPTEVRATRSQVEAAKAIVERNSATGHPTPEAIRKIAEAETVTVTERSPNKDRDTGRARTAASKGDLRISVDGRETDAKSLWDWLRGVPGILVQGVPSLEQVPGPEGTTSPLTELIVDVTSAGGAATLANSIKTWLEAQPGMIIKISGPNGQVVVRAEQTQDTERLLSNVLDWADGRE